MDEQNYNPMDTGGTTGTDNTYGTNEAQNPYSTSGTQDPYGVNGAQNPYGAGGAQNPYGTGAGQNPYGAGGAQNPYGTNGAASPYGTGGAQNPYGTNGAASPYGAAGMQNPYGTAAQSPYGSTEPPKPPKKKMSKKTKILLFGGIGLAVLVAAALVLCFTVFFPAMHKKTVKQAIDNMLGADGVFSNSLVLNEFGIKELAENFNNDGGELSADIKIGNKSNAELFSVEADVALDKSAKQLSGDIEISTKNEEIADVEIFSDAEQTYVTVEDLLNGYFAFNNNNIISGLKNSWLLADLPDSAKSVFSFLPDFSLDFFSSSSGFSLDKLTSDDNEFWKNSKISRDGSETLYAGEESISATKYSVTIPKEILQEQVSKLIDSSMGAISNSSIGSLLGQTGLSSTDLTQYISQIKALISSMFKDDLVYYVYIKDDKVVSIKTSLDLNLMAYTISVELDFTCFKADTQSVLNLSGVINVMGQKIEFKLNSNTKEEGDNLKTDATVSATAMGKELVSGYYSQTYSKSSRDISGSGSLTVKDKNLGSISVSGKVSELEAGKLLKLHLDDLTYTNSSGVNVITLSGDITLKTKAAGIDVKTRDTGKPVANLFTGTKEDAKAVYDETSEGYKKFMERFKKLFSLKNLELDDF